MLSDKHLGTKPNNVILKALSESKCIIFHTCLHYWIIVFRYFDYHAITLSNLLSLIIRVYIMIIMFKALDNSKQINSCIPSPTV